MFERLREAIEAALDAATSGSDHDGLRGMHEAVVEARVALDAMRDGIEKTERRLSAEQKDLADAERRGGLAADIGDTETQRIADEYAAKHRERVSVLERKLVAQRDEIALAEREFASMRDQLALARKQHPGTVAGDRIEAAWRDLQAAGGTRPSEDLDGEVLRAQFDRAAKEARAEEQLRQLKKKMGR